jgi:3-hydroxyacyl-[acyl-carrier-protein] dehydratase
VKQNQIVAFSEFDSNRILYDRSQIEQVNPHRFELSLLDGILYEDCQRWRFVGFADAKASDFWTRGHFPGQPLMPGVLICEVAAQLCSFMAIRHGQRTSSLMGLAGLDEVRFRRPVAPGDRLIMMIEQIRFRANALIQIRFQGFVKQELATEGTLKGAVLSPQSTSAEIAGATVFRD